MTEVALPIIATLFLWWLSTGVIVYLDSLAPRTFRWSMTGATALFAFSLWGVAAGSADATPFGAYKAFLFGLLAWGWQLVGFYMGYVAGPRRTACESDLRGWRRFVEAARTSLYHELAVCASAVVIAALAWGKPNQVALWTFVLLWLMHLSAKLNIYFGVPNLGEELLPPHLDYLKTFMRRKPMNLFFPASVSAATIVAVLLAQRAYGAQATPFETTSYAILATLTVLAVAEHWLLVAPLQINAIWRWRASATSAATEAVAGVRRLDPNPAEAASDYEAAGADRVRLQAAFDSCA